MPGQPHTFLHRRRQRRRLEDDRRRPHVDADLRRSADRLDRRDRGRAVRIPTSSTSAAARGSSGPTCRPATASTSRPTPAGPGRTSACATAQQIPQIVVDPKNPDRLFVAALGHPYGPNAERGIFRSTDGGKTLRDGALQGREHRRRRRRVRSRRTRTSSTPSLWEARQGPWENGAFSGPGQRPLQVDRRRHDLAASSPRACRRGTPIGSAASASAIAPSDPSRLFAIVDARANAAASIARTTPARAGRASTATRASSRGPTMSPRSRSHPTNPDIVYVPTHRRVEVDRRRQDVHGVPRRAGRRRLPADLDQPDNPDIMLMTVRPGRGRHRERRRDVEHLVQPADGAVLPRHAPTTRFRTASAAASRRAARRASRAAATTGRSRSASGTPVGVEEYGYVAPDPLDPDIVYGGKVTRFDRRTGQVQNVGPTLGARRRLPRGADACRCCSRRSIRARCSSRRTSLWKTTERRAALDSRSVPDLTRKTWEVPANVGIYASRRRAQPTQRGVIYTIAPSLHRRAARSGPAPTTG